MAIVASELKYYRSSTVNDTSSNGGRLASAEVVSGVAAALFPNVTPSERLAGLTRYRKVFLKVANAANLALSNAYVFLTKNTVGDDKVIFFAGTQRDVASAITGSERKYGGGQLKTNVSAAATTCIVTVEDGAVVLFANADKVRITNKPSIAGSGDEQFLTLSGAPSVSGNDVTLTFTATPLQYAFLAANTFISSVYVPGTDVVGTTTAFSKTSVGGSMDVVTYPIVVPSLGGVEQTWTCTFTTTTAYNIVGDVLGSIGAGNVGSGASITNPDFSSPYFTLPSAAFSGSWLAGDSFTFQTHPAAIPIWMRQIVPAAASVTANNLTALALTGETP